MRQRKVDACIYVLRLSIVYVYVSAATRLSKHRSFCALIMRMFAHVVHLYYIDILCLRTQQGNTKVGMSVCM